jgi:hypothetical protein
MTDKKYNTGDVAREVLDEFLGDLDRGIKRVGDSIDRRMDALYQRYSDLKADETFQDLYTSVKANATKGKEAIAGGLEALADKYNAAQDARVEEKPKLTGIVDGFYQIFTTHPARRSRKKDYVEGVGIGKAIGVGVSAGLVVSGGLISFTAGAVPAVIRLGPKFRDYLGRKVREAKDKLGSE